MDENTGIIIEKNLATCAPVEFLRQSNKIRHEVSGWLKATGVLELRKRKAEGKKSITADMTAEEKKAVNEYNRELDEAQAKQNISDMLDVCLEQYPEQTLEVIALACFLEKSQAKEVSVTELLDNFGQMLGDAGVMRFFTSLLKWEAILTSN